MPRIASTVLAFTMIASALSGCSSLSKTAHENPQPAAEAYVQSLDLNRLVSDLAEPLIDRSETPGLVVGVLLPDGTRHFYGYGTIAAGSAVLPTSDTVFPVGSLTKSMVAGLLELEIARGTLRWDDTLGQHFPDMPLSEDATRITLAELATHTSGLPRQPRSLKILRHFVQYLFTGRDFYRDLDATMTFDFLASWQNPDAQAEPQFRYSNIGYALIARVIEKRRGETIGGAIASEISAPLHLKATAVDAQHIPRHLPWVTGHAGDQPKFMRRGSQVDHWRMNTFMLGTGGVNSNADDLLAYVSAHLSPETSELSAALASTLRDKVGWLPLGDPDDGFLYQFGVMSGNSAFMGVDPHRQIGVVVLQNSFNWTDRVGLNLLGRLALSHDMQQLATQTKVGDQPSLAQRLVTKKIRRVERSRRHVAKSPT